MMGTRGLALTLRGERSRLRLHQAWALTIVAFREGRYWIRVQDAANESPPYVGGSGMMGEPDYRYTFVAAEAIVGGNVPIPEPLV